MTEQQKFVLFRFDGILPRSLGGNTVWKSVSVSIWDPESYIPRQPLLFGYFLVGQLRPCSGKPTANRGKKAASVPAPASAPALKPGADGVAFLRIVVHQRYEAPLAKAGFASMSESPLIPATALKSCGMLAG